MSIRRGMYEFLQSEVPAVQGRVYGVMQPQETEFPAITFELFDVERTYRRIDIFQTVYRMRVECWDRGYAAVNAVADDVRDASNGVEREIGGRLVRLLIENEQDAYDPVTKLYRVLFDLTMQER